MRRPPARPRSARRPATARARARSVPAARRRARRLSCRRRAALALDGLPARHRCPGPGRAEPRAVRGPAVARGGAREPGDRPRGGPRARPHGRLLRPLGRRRGDARRRRDPRIPVAAPAHRRRRRRAAVAPGRVCRDRARGLGGDGAAGARAGARGARARLCASGPCPWRVRRAARGAARAPQCPRAGHHRGDPRGRLRDQFRALRAAEFPWTADTVYLNNASIGPIPERTRRALDEFTAKRTAPHLLPDRELQAGLQAARVAVARFLNAEPDEIALATNTSHGLNLAARALPLQRGDVVLVSDREFPANVYPWMLLKKQGVEVELAPCAPEGSPDEDYLVERLHDPRVRVLAVSFVQFSNGYRADLARLGAACRANGTFLVVDGIQGVGNSPLDVRETAVDILACGANPCSSGRSRTACASSRHVTTPIAPPSSVSRRRTPPRRTTPSSGRTSCARCGRAPSGCHRTASTRWRRWSGCWMCWIS